jgi:putative membrane protein
MFNILIQTVIAMIAGIGFGIVTGITPGIHVNLVATTMLAVSPFLLSITSPLSLGVFIMALAVTHSFLDTIPSTYLGAPDSENALSVLPAQKMLLKGEAYQAVKISIVGAYFGLIVAILLAPLFMIIANYLYPIVKPFLIYLLLAIIIFMLFREKEKFWSITLFLLSGTLGVVVFSLPQIKEPLFPLLSGLFGLSGLMISFFENTKIPIQKITSEIRMKIKELTKIIFASTIGVFIIQFFPGMGAAQGAVLSNQAVKEIKDEGYLALVGAMGTMSVIFSLVTFFTLNKAKDGSIVALSKLVTVGSIEFILLLTVYLIAGSIAVFLTFYLSKKFSKIIVKINYKFLVTTIMIFIVIMCFFLNGVIGLLVMTTSTAVGLIAPLKNIPRSHAMGCLLLPVVFYLIF